MTEEKTNELPRGVGRGFEYWCIPASDCSSPQSAVVSIQIVAARLTRQFGF